MTIKQTTFSDFLRTFSTGVDALESRARAGSTSKSSQTSSPAVVTCHQSAVPSAGQVFIGMGHWVVPSDSGGFTRIDHEGICLNNKGAHLALDEDRPFASLCDLVLSENETLWQEWDNALGDLAPPEHFFASFQLVVEDASPDSCLSLLLFLARANGVPAEQLPAKWIAYVRRWEAGDVISTGAPMHSYGALHNAIAHSFIDRDWLAAWVHALRFLADCIDSNWQPEALPVEVDSARLMHARSLMRFEEQAYRDSLQYASRLQLRLPIAGTSGRYRLVDAYLAEEHIPLGSLKVFLRNDGKSTFLKSGYTLMGLHKPAEAGSGNDMTVSLTPDCGLHLTDLWEELERLEDEAWGQDRPCDKPRSDISLYPAGRRPDGRVAPDQPWYINSDHSLIGAPRLVGDSAQLGSRLDWEQVCEAIWCLYNPFRDFQVICESGATTTLQGAPPESLESSLANSTGKRLVMARWKTPSHAEGSSRGQVHIGFTPVLKRYLAACILRADHPDVRLKDLPEGDHFDFIELDGGFCVVSRHGAFVIDDWRSTPLDRDKIRIEFENACIRRALIDDMGARIKDLYADVEKTLKKGLDAGGSKRLLNRMAAMRLKVGQCWTETMTRTYDPGIIQFREALESRFGIAGRLELFHDSLDRIGSMLDSYIEYKTSSRLAFLTFYGFPIVLFSSLIGIALVHFQSHFETLGWTPLQLGVKTILLFLALVFMGMMAIRTWNWWNARRTRLRAGDFDDDPPENQS